jgi:hypothetical protein
MDENPDAQDHAISSGAQPTAKLRENSPNYDFLMCHLWPSCPVTSTLGGDAGGRHALNRLRRGVGRRAQTGVVEINFWCRIPVDYGDGDIELEHC